VVRDVVHPEYSYEKLVLLGLFVRSRLVEFGHVWWGLFFGNSRCYSPKKKHPFKNPATSPRNKRILLKIWECLFPKVLQRKNIWWVVIWYNPFHWLRGKNWYYCKWRNSRISFNAQSSETLHFGLTKSYSQWHHPQLHGNRIYQSKRKLLPCHSVFDLIMKLWILQKVYPDNSWFPDFERYTLRDK